MSEPIAPDDIEGLAKAAYQPLHDQSWQPPFEERDTTSMNRYRAVARGVRDALVPEGYVVVSRDDLRVAIDAWKNDGRMPAAIYDRLQATLD